MGTTRRGFLFHSARFAGLLAVAPAACLAAPEDSLGRRQQLDGAPVSLRGAQLQADPVFTRRYGAALRAMAAATGEPNGPVLIQVEYLGSASAPALPPVAASALALRPQGYWIEVAEDRVVIVGGSPEGALHGLAFMENLVQTQAGIISSGQVLDWPDHPQRALHFVIRKLGPEPLRHVIDLARRARLNTLILSLADCVRYESLPEVARDDALSWSELEEAVRYARESGFTIIPQLTLLTHQEVLLKQHRPELLFNKVTYDPRKRDTWRVVLPLIDEVLGWLAPAALHIGHDEVAGLTASSRATWLRPGEKALPRELFKEHVKRVFEFLEQRGVETWMWGDMLIAPEEFPQLQAAYMHGIQGYARLRRELPRELVICDWHYSDGGLEFPTARAFAEAGYGVLGATWKRDLTIRNFSSYAHRLTPAAQGMVATTWYHVPRQEWAIVSAIITSSGNAFWKAG